MKIVDRYSTAVHSSNLGSKPETTASDSDVLGAAGLAARRVPLGVALMRLLAGDNHASADVVRILADKAVGKAYRMGNECGRSEAEDLGRAVLAWYRHGTCARCGGHGVLLIPGTTTLGDTACPACRGDGRIRLDRQVPLIRLELARWLVAEVERELAFAGPAAMRALARTLDL
jgi:hypothetical protein